MSAFERAKGGWKGSHEACLKERKPLGRPRHRWEDNTKMDLKEIGWKGVGSIFLAYDRDQWQAMNTVTNLGSNKRQGVS